jgi:HAE1 family hydrophobic/amphiphilic exporter-1
MTALTTILALTGMAIGFGEGAKLLQPLAVTAIGGLIYSTISS